MPGPFPGMDPYLEHPVLSSGMAFRLITSLSETLNALLPPGYAAAISERIYVPSGNSEEVREVFLQILSPGEVERIVTIIEIFTHTTKTPDDPGRQLYRTWQREVLGSPMHLLEIDLLRAGAHTVSAPAEGLRERGGPWDYRVCLHRAGGGAAFEIWPSTVRERLPQIPVPLTDGEPDVILDLQAVFDRCWDAEPYRPCVDYRQAPTPPLAGEDAAWADALLREKGLRPQDFR